MNVLITGGAGFLGQRLARRLLVESELTMPDGHRRTIDHIHLLDVVPGPDFGDPRIRVTTGDVSDQSLLERLIDADTTSIFHLAAVVSGQAESDFELGMRINLDATRRLLDVCRAVGHRPRVVFASSVAVYGGELPDVVVDQSRLAPQSSYGTQKAIGELLVNDYSRRAFIDGRALRLPTISVRPGKPNAALSSFASGIIREPLAGVEAICPVIEDTRLWLLSPATMIETFLLAHEIAGDALGPNRSLIVPGLSVTVREMVDALERVAGADVTKLIRWERDPRVERVSTTWPGRLDDTRARKLGFPVDHDFEAVIRRYMAEDMPAR